MSDDLKANINIVKQPVFVAWPKVFIPEHPDKAGKAPPVYTARLVFDPDNEDLMALQVAAGKILKTLRPKATFGKSGLVARRDFNYPFRRGEDVIADAMRYAEENEKVFKPEYHEYQEGKMVLYVKAKETNPPKLAFLNNGKWVDLDTPDARQAHEDKFFHGMTAYAQLALRGYDIPGPRENFGVTCYLNRLGAVGGTAFGGFGSSTAAVFPTTVTSSAEEDIFPNDTWDAAA